MAYQNSFFVDNENIEYAVLLKSYRSFKKYFEDCKSAKVITFNASPKHIKKTFDQFNLEQLEIIVGDTVDFRNNLVGELELAKEMEGLKAKKRLIIHTLKSNSKPKIHAKIYILRKNNGEIQILHGSPNFSSNAWGRQHETVTDFNTYENSKCHNAFLKIWSSEINYCSIFLEDLSEELENVDEEERDEIINLWIDGKTTNSVDEIGEINKKIISRIFEVDITGEESDLDIQIYQNIRGYDDKTKEYMKEQFSMYKDTSVTNDIFKSSIKSIASSIQHQSKLPLLNVRHNQLLLYLPNRIIKLSEELPQNKQIVKEHLKHIESYFETVASYAICTDIISTQMHMFEALLHVFWAPFINAYAQFFYEKEMLQTKQLPFLYISGEPNSGKSSFTAFLLKLISKGYVTKASSADGIGLNNIRVLKRTMTSFPFIIDDIEKTQLHSFAKVLRDYWSNWQNDLIFPNLVFTSNDRKPNDWFLKRAKKLNFELMFEGTNESQLKALQITKKSNLVFNWLSQLHLEIINSKGIDVTEDDYLYIVRKIYMDLYNYADLEVPVYFPKEPAEKLHDPGLKKWEQAFSDEILFFEKVNENQLNVSFDKNMEYWDIREYKKALPNKVRAEQEGAMIRITNPKNFYQWMNIDHESKIIRKIKSFFKL